MIFLSTTDNEQTFSIDRDLVITYKRTGDRYLVALYHELTKQLISYTIYYDLQQVDNSFYRIIKGLLADYENLDNVSNDYSILVRDCNTFVKNCSGSVSDSVYEVVTVYIDKLKLLMEKLVYIANNICTNTEEVQ